MEEKLTLARKVLNDLDLEIRSRRPIIYISTYEEKRVINDIMTLCRLNKNNNTQWNLYSWDIAAGLKNSLNPTEEMPNLNNKPNSILDWFNELEGSTQDTQILILKDYHKLLGTPNNSGIIEHQVIRTLKNLYESFLRKRKTIIFISSVVYLPDELRKLFTVIDWPLPEIPHIQEKINKALEDTANNHKLNYFKLNYTDGEMYSLARSFQGLTLDEIELSISKMILQYKEFSPNYVIQRKKNYLKQNGILEWLDVDVDFNQIGGLSILKTWLSKRMVINTPEAIEYGLPNNPKGVFIAGIPGCGKTLTAKSIANQWKIPLLRLNVGKIFGGIVGSSEENLQKSIKIAEAMSPCVLLIDEMEKVFSSSTNHDGGTTNRIVGEFLYWMGEKTAPVFIVATANDISNMRPEILRKGRFDEIFFVDLPNDEERKDIFKIHIKLKNRNPDDFDIDELSANSKYYIGSEIEACIVEAMFEAFCNNREFDTDDIINALNQTVPLSYTMRESMSELQAWAKDRAKNASEGNMNLRSKSDNLSYNKRDSWLQQMENQAKHGTLQ